MSSPSSSTPPPAPARSAGVYGAAKKWRPFGDGAGAHVRVEDVGQRAEDDTEFFGRLAADRGVRVVRVEQSGRGLDEHPVGVVVDVGGVAELAGEQDAAACGVVGKDDGAVATVVRLADLGFPASVAAEVVEGGATKDVPALGGQFDVADPDAGVAVEVPPRSVEPCPAAVVRDVHPGAGLHAAPCRSRAGI